MESPILHAVVYFTRDLVATNSIAGKYVILVLSGFITLNNHITNANEKLLISW